MFCSSVSLLWVHRQKNVSRHRDRSTLAFRDVFCFVILFFFLYFCSQAVRLTKIQCHVLERGEIIHFLHSHIDRVLLNSDCGTVAQMVDNTVVKSITFYGLIERMQCVFWSKIAGNRVWGVFRSLLLHRSGLFSNFLHIIPYWILKSVFMTETKVLFFTFYQCLVKLST